MQTYKYPLGTYMIHRDTKKLYEVTSIVTESNHKGYWYRYTATEVTKHPYKQTHSSSHKHFKREFMLANPSILQVLYGER